MSTRTVTVHLKAAVGEYLASMHRSEKATKDLREEVDKLDKAGSSMTKGGLRLALAGIPGVASGAAASMAGIPAIALSSVSAFSTLKVATLGVGDAFKAVGEQDAAKLAEAMAGLSKNARAFVREYQKVRPALAAVATRTQDAFFGQLLGNLDKVTNVYMPVLLRQMPHLATELGVTARGFASWATTPEVVGKVNRQFKLATDLVDDFGRILKAGTGLFLDLADAGREFTETTVGGLANGTEALEHWVAIARGTGQLDQIFANGQRILQQLGETAAKVGLLLADIVDNPALVDGAEALFNVLHVGLDVVRALLAAFESLPPGMQSTIVTLAVVGGSILSVTGRVVALKGAFGNLRVSAGQAGGALKNVGGVLAGPWGGAVALGTTLLGAFVAQQLEAKTTAETLTGTLDEQTGAITEATRQQVVNNLANSGAIDLAKQLGLDINEMTTAVLGGSKATEQWYLKQVELAGGFKEADHKFSPLIDKLGIASGAVDTAKVKWHDMRVALGLATGGVRAQITAIKELGDLLHAQNDPAFALIKAQKDVGKAQADYDKAVKEHGKGSKEAKDASLTLAELSINLADAVGGASEAFNGKMSPALRATLRAAGLTERQIKDIEQAFKDAKAAGDAFAKNYKANVSLSGDATAIERITELNRQLRLLVGNKKIHITYDGSARGGFTERRWGGIDYAMARGGAIEAHYASSPTVLYGERATGGEAFIPRNGDPARSMSILSTAASWYGMRLAGGGLGGGGTTTVVHEHRHTVVLDGRGVLNGFRKEIELRGGNVQNATGARRG